MEEDFLSTEEIKELEKLASMTSTQPMYISEHGDVFTAADIVKGKGKIHGKGGAYSPKKWKGYSLADKVQSKDFGKTK